MNGGSTGSPLPEDVGKKPLTVEFVMETMQKL